MVTLVLVLVLVAMVVAFSVQNASPVAVSFLLWKFEASLAIVVLLSVLAGLLVGIVIASVAGVRRRSRQARDRQPGQPPGAQG